MSLSIFFLTLLMYLCPFSMPLSPIFALCTMCHSHHSLKIFLSPTTSSLCLNFLYTIYVSRPSLLPLPLYLAPISATASLFSLCPCISPLSLQLNLCCFSQRNREIRREPGSAWQCSTTTCLNRTRLGYIRRLGWAPWEHS